MNGSQKVMKLKKYSFRWVPDSLSDSQKAARVEMAASMLSIPELSTARARSWTLTKDESWFSF
jgi:hypothetical protein